MSQLKLSDRIVVVGASLAGLRTLEALRREGHGGEIVALSAESHMPYDRPPLSKQFLKGEWQEDRLALRRQGYDDLAVDWRLGARAVALDPVARQLELEGGGRLDYGGLVIATGSAPRWLPGSEGKRGVHVLRGLDDAQALRDALARARRLVVIGAGFIGMEVAATARAMGLEVAVVEALPAPLWRGLGSRLGELVGRHHREQGVDLRCGVSVKGLVGEQQVSGVALSDGSLLDADVVLVAIGVAPICGWLAGSGLVVDDGIVCDAAGGAGLPDVVSVGDCARWHDPLRGRAIRHEHWTSAVEQSAVAAARLLEGGASARQLAQVPYVWTDQFDLRIAIAGEVREGDALHVCHGSLEEGRFLALFGRAGLLTGAVGFRRPRQLNDARTLIEQRVRFEDAIAQNA